MAAEGIAGVASIFMDDVGGIIVVLRVHTEGNHLFAGDAFDRLAGVEIIAVIDYRPGGHLGKLVEGGNDVVQRLKVFQMVGIYI